MNKIIKFNSIWNTQTTKSRAICGWFSENEPSNYPFQLFNQKCKRVSSFPLGSRKNVEPLTGFQRTRFMLNNKRVACFCASIIGHSATHIEVMHLSSNQIGHSEYHWFSVDGGDGGNCAFGVTLTSLWLIPEEEKYSTTKQDILMNSISEKLWSHSIGDLQSKKTPCLMVLYLFCFPKKEQKCFELSCWTQKVGTADPGSPPYKKQGNHRKSYMVIYENIKVIQRP